MNGTLLKVIYSSPSDLMTLGHALVAALGTAGLGVSPPSTTRCRPGAGQGVRLVRTVGWSKVSGALLLEVLPSYAEQLACSCILQHDGSAGLEWVAAEAMHVLSEGRAFRAAVPEVGWLLLANGMRSLLAGGGTKRQLFERLLVRSTRRRAWLPEAARRGRGWEETEEEHHP
jgi:hypothetical protein